MAIGGAERTEVDWLVGRVLCRRAGMAAVAEVCAAAAAMDVVCMVFNGLLALPGSTRLGDLNEAEGVSGSGRGWRSRAETGVCWKTDDAAEPDVALFCAAAL